MSDENVTQSASMYRAVHHESTLLLYHCHMTVQVEDEMRELLSVMEQQKTASAAKVKQLANILQDMQSPGPQ